MSKLRMAKSKYALKKLYEWFGVLVCSIHRPKQGFAMQIVHRFRKELNSEIGHNLLEPRSLTRGYFDPSGMRTLLEEPISAPCMRSGRVDNV
jgi:hypothetical protein